MAGWSTTNPWNKSWGTETTGNTLTASHYYVRGLFSYARGNNNTLYVKCVLQVNLISTDYAYYPYSVRGDVKIGNGSYVATPIVSVGAGEGPNKLGWTTVGPNYYLTTTASSSDKVYCRSGWSSTTLVSSDTVLSAKPYTTQYTITYNGNEANSGSTSPKTATYGVATTVSSNGFTKSGYTFVKWNTSANGGGTDYYPGGSITIYGNTTLYAIWSQITYTVTYNGNGADGGSTSVQTKVWGTPLPLSANGFTRTNYTFQHWNTAADDSGTSYNAGASYTTNAALTLYAIWKKNNIPVFIRDGNDVIQVEKAFMRVGNDIKECTIYQRIGNEIIVYQ